MPQDVRPTRDSLRTSHHSDEYDFGFMTVRVMKAMGLVKASPQAGKNRQASHSRKSVFNPWLENSQVYKMNLDYLSRWGRR